MRTFPFTLFVLGLMRHYGAAVNSLREAAVRWDGELPCSDWDCDCAFRRQRGCCCAAADLAAVEDQIFIRMMEVSRRLTQLGDDALQVTGEMKVAFTASMSPSTHCYGPFTRNKPIPYDSISLNHGRGYNPALGVFTAPSSGIYSFSLSVYSRVRTAGDRMYHKVQLMRNGEVVASTWEDDRDDSEDSASQTVLLSLQRGGQVYVELLSSRRLCGSVPGLNSFSGALIYPSAA